MLIVFLPLDVCGRLFISVFLVYLHGYLNTGKNNKNVCLMEIILTLVLYHVIQHSKVHLLPT